MGYLNTFITKQAAGFTGPVPIEGMNHAQWNNFAKELGPLTGQPKSFYRNSAAMSDYMAQHGLRNMDDLTAHIQGLRGGGAPGIPGAGPAPAPAHAPAPAASRAPLGLPAPANTPVNPAVTAEIVDDVPTRNMRNASPRMRPAGAPVAPTTQLALPAPAPTTTAIVPHQAPAPAAAPAPANKSINYARRTWNSAKSLGRNAMGMGRQGFAAAKAMAKRNPKLAALLAIGGTLAGGSLMAGAANSGRPPVRQSNATNPFAGLETY